MPHMLGDHGSWVIVDENYVMVSNHNEIISVIAPMTRVNAWMLKLWSAYERLDLHCDEV